MRVAKAGVATFTIQNLQKLSIKTVVALFKIKILPVAAYGITLIWKYLSFSNLLSLERVKTNFLKRALGVPKRSGNRLIYLLSGEASMIEDLRQIYSLEETDAYKKISELHKKKSQDVAPHFYQSPAMKHQS